MVQWFHSWLQIWFGWMEATGYWGVFVLMACESSILPVPSELVLPPAAFWASQGRMNFYGVIAIATLGSYVGSVVSYVLARWSGPYLFKILGKFFFISQQKLHFAEYWTQRLGPYGVFFARLLPGVRHIISIPAGFLKLSFWSFSLATSLGAGIWCAILAWFGEKVIGHRPELLQSPEAMIAVVQEQMHWLLFGFLVLGSLFGVVFFFYDRWSKLNKS